MQDVAPFGVVCLIHHGGLLLSAGVLSLASTIPAFSDLRVLQDTSATMRDAGMDTINSREKGNEDILHYVSTSLLSGLAGLPHHSVATQPSNTDFKN